MGISIDHQQVCLLPCYNDINDEVNSDNNIWHNYLKNELRLMIQLAIDLNNFLLFSLRIQKRVSAQHQLKRGELVQYSAALCQYRVPPLYQYLSVLLH